MSKFIKSVLAINLAVIVLQFCLLGFEIYRWNEIVGSIFSIVVSLLGYVPAGIGETKERWFMGLYSFLLFSDLIFQLVNMILLIRFQWIVIQFCIHSNVSVDITDYGGVSCNDWWHFGYGEINYRDRALIVTVLLAIIVLIRLIQTVLVLASLFKRASKPMFFVGRDANHEVYLSRRGEITTQT